MGSQLTFLREMRCPHHTHMQSTSAWCNTQQQINIFTHTWERESGKFTTPPHTKRTNDIFKNYYPVLLHLNISTNMEASTPNFSSKSEREREDEVVGYISVFLMSHQPLNSKSEIGQSTKNNKIQYFGSCFDDMANLTSATEYRRSDRSLTWRVRYPRRVFRK